LTGLIGGKDIDVVAVSDLVIVQTLDDHRCLLLGNNSRRLCDEVLRILLKLSKDTGL